MSIKYAKCEKIRVLDFFLIRFSGHFRRLGFLGGVGATEGKTLLPEKPPDSNSVSFLYQKM